jgi:NAD(P)-dependent dehydrogenase (short-subunit alcohol dehydrogenase family)
MVVADRRRAHANRGVVIVTGGAGGLGTAIVRRFLAAGWPVVATDVTPPPDPLTLGSKTAEFRLLDVTDEAHVADTLSDVGPIEVLINAAGVTLPGKLVGDITLTDWRRILDVNLTGTFLCTRFAAEQMRERESGRIVNVASCLATRGVPRVAAYSASKAGVIGFTQAVAAELAPYRVTVNAVAPGHIDTPMLADLPESFHSTRLSEIGLGRYASPDEIAAVIEFLTSEEAAYVTGAVIEATGGFRIGS